MENINDNDLPIMVSAIKSINKRLAYKLSEKYKNNENITNDNVDALLEVLFLLNKYEHYEAAEKIKNRIEYLGGDTFKKSNLYRLIETY